ncbi:hypothetical protein Y032_0505g2658 [Ancylostoma ceylanicum]|uniref:Uncharacterized protein n=1 Tax=Ancylostoma ceylanicum TaxID=53326 RepID=A0A016WTE6_9BILA|nr:hypothetical protein Y032_0505g2658 [Ancylostoma ceylanicum]
MLTLLASPETCQCKNPRNGKGSTHGKFRSENFDSFEKPDLGSTFAVQAALQVSLYLFTMRLPRTRRTCFSADCTRFRGCIRLL